ncbi:hypothetical protein A3B40_01585 [Candidatus Roizmanbacteria bacterium RIFCSPLOWO2_01_FULL_37_16]|uniref:ADP-dependent (S)-NAD(P)H-hydrate dehydratase n=1 Tax=Candidatus Roizmanbacteria bacterium RIFCSPLOWO2_01_FULL_37_16 TaxID=1802058 RepID=A0A1F7ILQ0_9BACT|nr:MAG: hypothetical protein A2859_00115 [Candidatus Roizmanbacteria bacterium RIFCSPHIGHO2_01_FULL_37_16b]OGK44309.1 MAG: hypothetical protein A3B40_01585 [Candidatus Roizmanbacteria bacterium RIFCSPLOWO2_01_FULL_37_16]
MMIKTSDTNSIKLFLENIHLPQPNSHKGQNGRVLIIGGSTLFHSASIWAAEITSHFVDMVHYCSTWENEEIFVSLKRKIRNGIVVSRKDLLSYIEEDDAILIGPGMVRGKISNFPALPAGRQFPISNFKDILRIKDEAMYTYYLTKYLLEEYPHKKFVLDAGALQMMKPEWLVKLKTKAIVTPHQGEFKRLFGLSVDRCSVDEKEKIVKEQAKKYNCVILLKAVRDYISDGEKTVVVDGGNAGLTKGGTGDILAGLTVSFFAKNPALDSCAMASYILKRSADEIFLKKGYWYNIKDIIDHVPIVTKQILIKK